MSAAASAIHVIRDPSEAAILMNPARLRILENLQEPGSAASLSRDLGISRQKINYHLRELESNGMVEPVEERRKGNCIERVVRAVARHYLVSPDVLGDPAQIPVTPDRFSSAYLIATIARVLRDLIVLRGRADKAGKPLATMTIETEVRFASAERRKAFTDELASEIARLAAKYHDENAEGGRKFKFVIGAYPTITKTAEDSRDSVRVN
jgi:DNA-binding transcriptional ArsR family regulator